MPMKKVGCGGPIRTVYTIIEHTVPQRIDSFRCLTPLFASVRSVKTAPFSDCLGKSSFNPSRTCFRYLTDCDHETRDHETRCSHT